MRVRLLERYARSSELQDVNLEAMGEQTAGASPVYIKEPLRKAALLAAVVAAGVAVTPPTW